jgi:hypothetical protein
MHDMPYAINFVFKHENGKQSKQDQLAHMSGNIFYCMDLWNLVTAISRRGTECLMELQAEVVQMTWGRSGRASGTSRSTTVQVPAASDDQRAACPRPLRAAAAVELGCSGGGAAPLPPAIQSQPWSRTAVAALSLGVGRALRLFSRWNRTAPQQQSGEQRRAAVCSRSKPMWATGEGTEQR